MAKHQRDPDKEARWRARLKRHATTGLSVRAFCRRERVTESAFYFWRRVIAERDGEKVLPAPSSSKSSPMLPAPETSDPATALPPFVPVAIAGPRAGTRGRDTSMVIELAGGRVLRLPESIPAGRLAELVHAIESRGKP